MTQSQATSGHDLPTAIRVLPDNGPTHEAEHIGYYGRISQATPRQFKRLAITSAALIVVRSGRKVAATGPYAVDAGPGHLIGIAAGEVIDLVNYGPAAGEPYVADCFSFNDALVRQMSSALPPDCKRAALFSLPSPLGFEQSAELAREALDPVRGIPPEIVRHRLSELLLWLMRGGVYYTSRREPTLAVRVRELVAGNLARDWTAAEIAAALNMTEPTLRRRLRQAGTSITETLGDARMSVGLGMLQTSAMPIDRVALEVGYASPSKFAVRFRARFGLSPHEIRKFDSHLLVSGRDMSA